MNVWLKASKNYEFSAKRKIFWLKVFRVYKISAEYPYMLSAESLQALSTFSFASKTLAERFPKTKTFQQTVLVNCWPKACKLGELSAPHAKFMSLGRLHTHLQTL